jgi:hypothetical protein
MKGLNKLLLSDDELCQAINFYLTNKLFNPHEKHPKVVKVQLHDDGKMIDKGLTNIAEVWLQGEEE